MTFPLLTHPLLPQPRLEVAGLAEKRPSVIVSDVINVRESNSPSHRWFQGHVHRVLDTHVHLRFARSFSAIRGQRFDVRFELNRVTFKRMHQALNTAFVGRKMVFPRVEDLKALKAPTEKDRKALTGVERVVKENEKQMEAISAIVNRPRGSVPFVVFGP
jgi:helicase MOV-10